MFICRPRIGTAPATKEVNAEQLPPSPKLFTFREAGTGFSGYNVTPLPAAPPCLPLDIKDSLKEDMRFLLWGILLVGLLMWEALEGKRIAEGKVLEGDC
jgi:hypothetical protein